MATGSADGADVSVELPPPLDEWIDERAASAGVDREELLVQVVSAYRAAADLDDGDVDAPVGDGADVDERIETEVRAQLRDRERDLAAIDDRIDGLEADLETDLESLRNRVLQLRDAVRNRARTDHTHEEFGRFADRLDAVATDVADLSDAVTDLETEVADARTKLDTLARVVLELKGDGVDPAADRRRALDQLRATANRRGVTDASCHACGDPISIPLLSDPSCPHCDAELRDVTTTGILFTRATLTGPEPAVDAVDADRGESDADTGEGTDE